MFTYKISFRASRNSSEYIFLVSLANAINPNSVFIAMESPRVTRGADSPE
ncbi:hypothetical protein [Flavihumibacter petaseus]|nr:hypothetical protein [Flavihumibacter petaseus]